MSLHGGVRDRSTGYANVTVGFTPPDEGFLRSRVRLLAVMTAVSALLFTAAAGLVDGLAPSSVYGWVGIELTVALAAFVMAPRLTGDRAVSFAGLAVCLAIYLGTAGSAVVFGEISTMPIVFCAVSVGAAALLLWGPAYQVVLVLGGAVALLTNVFLVTGTVIAGIAPPEWTAIAVSGLGSIYIAWQFERFRLHASEQASRIELANDELRRANASLEGRVVERTAELEAMNRDLQTFSLSVSHDLRAPLRTLDGFAHVLSEDFAAELSPKALEFFDRLRAASQRLDGLVDDLLTLVRATRGEYRNESVDLASMAAEVGRELRSGHPSRSVEFTIYRGLDAMGDPGLLRVVLRKLMENAWKYTREREHAHITVGVTGSRGVAAYFVRDDGVGFDMNEADRLFVAFERLHAGQSALEGTGLGLATVRTIVERHGGRVWAESGPSGGATFFFTLEKEGSPRSARTPEPAPSPLHQAELARPQPARVSTGVGGVAAA